MKNTEYIRLIFNMTSKPKEDQILPFTLFHNSIKRFQIYKNLLKNIIENPSEQNYSAFKFFTQTPLFKEEFYLVEKSTPEYKEYTLYFILDPDGIKKTEYPIHTEKIYTMEAVY